MPTGYTHNIPDGISFEEFAMQCSRAFGALITMRDEPNNAEIPEKFEPSDYHINQLEDARRKLKELKTMPIDDIKQRTLLHNERQIKQLEESKEKEKKLESSYRTMLENVKKWNPPSPDHEELKSFMKNQITESIKFDCGYYNDRVYNEITPDEWFELELKETIHDIEYHEKEHQKEVERTESRNKWLSQLRESLK